MRYVIRSLLLVALSFISLNTNASTVATNASVQVENYPLQLLKSTDLTFGTIAPSGTLPGSVLVSPGGAVTANGGVTIISSASAYPAAYIVYGVPNSTFSVILPSEAIITNGSSNMVIRDFAPSMGATATIYPEGFYSFTLGATLIVSPGQLPGTYSGTFNVTVAYN